MNPIVNVIKDELVKSHILYVVHASTKPVLSEPSTLRQAQGERLFPNVLSEVEGSAQHERNINRLSRASRDSP